MVQGTQHNIARPTASAGRDSSTEWCRIPRYAAHPSKKGNIEPNDGLVISAKPHSTPYPAQSRHRADSASSNVAHKMIAISNADSDVSQIHSYGSIIALGKIAHSPAAPLATPLPASFLPIK